jgi:hypothetical protein
LQLVQREQLDDSTPVVFLWVYSTGIVNHGDRKGYLFTRGSPTPLLRSLDGNVRRAASYRSHYVVYREVGSGWYLEYDW